MAGSNAAVIRTQTSDMAKASAGGLPDRDGIAFERIYWRCVQDARPKQPGELVLSFDLPTAQFVARSTVYRCVSVWLLDNYLSDALQDERMAFEVG